MVGEKPLLSSILTSHFRKEDFINSAICHVWCCQGGSSSYYQIRGRENQVTSSVRICCINIFGWSFDWFFFHSEFHVLLVYIFHVFACFCCLLMFIYVFFKSLYTRKSPYNWIHVCTVYIYIIIYIYYAYASLDSIMVSDGLFTTFSKRFLGIEIRLTPQAPTVNEETFKERKLVAMTGLCHQGFSWQKKCTHLTTLYSPW